MPSVFESDPSSVPVRKTDYFGSFLESLASNETLATLSQAGRSVVAGVASQIGTAAPDPLNMVVKTLQERGGQSDIGGLVTTSGGSLESLFLTIDKLRTLGLVKLEGGIVTLTDGGRSTAATLAA
jgi:hypothetical protein